MYRNRRSGRLPQRVAPVGLQIGGVERACRVWVGRGDGEVRVKLQRGGRGADVVSGQRQRGIRESPSNRQVRVGQGRRLLGSRGAGGQ